MTALDAQAISRIVDAVRAGAKCELPEIDRASLQSEIEYARTCYDDMRVLGDKTVERELRRRVTQIRKSAQRIVDHMDPKVCGVLDRMDLHDRYRQTPEDILRAVQHLIRLIDYRHPPEAYTSDPWRLYGWPGSPFVRIAGRYLRNVFERHFGMTAGYTFDDATDTKEVRGAYVDFVERVLIELQILNKGKAYTRQSIADALTETRQQEAERENLAAE